MLQQTQTGRVVQKYREFIKAFPTARALAQARAIDVLKLWSGLGYNRRALMLHQAAGVIVNKWHGRIPRNQQALATLPGVGINTAGALLAYAYNVPAVFIETNIRSVFIHEFLSKHDSVSDAAIAVLVKRTVDNDNPREWYWALMDYGVMIKKRFGNPNRTSRHYARQSKFAGSNRQLRGKIIKLLLNGALHESALIKALGQPPGRSSSALRELEAEGFIVISQDKNGTLFAMR